MTRAQPQSTVPLCAAPEVDSDRIKASLVRLMQDFSIELMPRESRGVGPLCDHLPRGTRVYVTRVRTASARDSLETAARVRREGMRPVPHLAARLIRDEAELGAILTALAGAGVTDALLIGGSVDPPVGRFDSVMQLLETGLFARNGIETVRVAGHPEGSPDIPTETLDAALREKNAFASRTAQAMRITTQFCFEAAPILDWERRVRSTGNRLGIDVGLAGLASLPTLIRHARFCGVGASLGALLRQGGRMARLTTAVAPGEVLTTLARGCLADPASKIERVHFFPFGSFHATAAWAGALAAGAFAFDDAGNNVIVDTASRLR
ncbi:MAG: metFprotein [Casimicrobiaceae bacterium]